LKAIFSTLLAIFSLTVCGSAQTGNLFKKAPEGVEEALRARVTEFFNLQMEGKFRAAEGCVCDDTKDYFYGLKKKTPRGFDLDKVEFGEDFATANVLVSIGADIPTINGIMRMVAPMATQWRLEKDQWCFFAPAKQQTTIRTPFGEVSETYKSGNTQPQAMNQSMIRPVTVSDLQKAVSVSADKVIFDATKPAAAEIELTNSLPGTVQVATQGTLPPGVKVKISPEQLKSKEVAKARFEFTPGQSFPDENYAVQFLVEPTRQKFLIKVVFELPAEQRKQAQKTAVPGQQ